MKNTVVHILIFFFSFASSYETIKCFSALIGDTSICCIKDLSCEEESSESEESNEKTEKLSLYDDLYLNSDLASSQNNRAGLIANRNNNFSSSDYSQVIYSPPKSL